MKSFSLTALAALLFIAVVSAAPSHSSASFPQLSIDDALDRGNDFMEKYIKFLECVRDVIGNAVAESSLKPIYEGYKQKAEALIKNNLLTCRSVKDAEQKALCIFDVVFKINKIYEEFLEKVYEANKGIFEKIEKGVNECAKKDEFKIFVADTYAPSIREQLQCQNNALGEASTKNGLTEEWKQYEPKFKQHFDAWKQCDSADAKLKKIFCNIKEGAYSFGLFIKYANSIALNPNFHKIVQDFNRIVKEKCTA